MIKYSIAITTKNRCEDLKFTLNSLKKIIERVDVELLICDDNSTDGTVDFLEKECKNCKVIFNKKSLGLIHNRNTLNNLAKGEFIISLDDDSNFLSGKILENIENYFNKTHKCGLLTFRVFWSKSLPKSIKTYQKAERVKSFIGCGHVWKKQAWKAIPDYPSWFVFYGEEDFASYQLYKKNIEIHYFPDILVHHRVNLLGRKKHKDYYKRQRRSLRSGWYLYGIFYPKRKIPRLFIYTLFTQLKNKVIKQRDMRSLKPIFLAFFDVIFNLPKILTARNSLTLKEYNSYKKLPNQKIYWKVEE